MNKYQEALEVAKIEYFTPTDEGTKEKQEAYKILQELVDNFGDFEATLDFLIKLTQKNMRTAYGRDFDYYNGVLDTLSKFKETLYKKEGNKDEKR